MSGPSRDAQSNEPTQHRRVVPGKPTSETTAVDLVGSLQRQLKAPTRGVASIPNSSVAGLGHIVGNRALQRVLADTPDGRRNWTNVVLRDDDPPVATAEPVVTPPKAKEAEDPLSKKTSLKIINDAFSDVKKDLSEGKVEVLEQAAFQVAWDKIYGKTIYKWDPYIKSNEGNLEGFAHGGVNYINKSMASTNIGTVVHEMLHSNTAADWTGVVGSEFNEGTTEYLSLIATTKAKAPYGKSYPEQLKAVEELVAAGLPESCVKEAYLNGGAQKLVADWFDKTMEGTWADFKASMQAEEFAKARAKIKKKTAEPAK